MQKVYKDEEKQENDLARKEKICDNLVKGGFFGTIGGGLLTAAGAIVSPFCPPVGTGMIYAGLTTTGASLTAELGGLAAGT